MSSLPDRVVGAWAAGPPGRRTCATTAPQASRVDRRLVSPSFEPRFAVLVQVECTTRYSAAGIWSKRSNPPT